MSVGVLDVVERRRLVAGGVNSEREPALGIKFMDDVSPVEFSRKLIDCC